MLDLRSLTGSLTVNVVLLILAWYMIFAARSYWRLNHVPGPKLNGWTVLPLFQLHRRGRMLEEFGDLHRKYGPLVRVAPNTLLVADPDVLRRMSAVRSPFTRADWHIALRLIPGEDSVVSTRDEKRHDDLRKKMVSGYSGKENTSLEPDIDECVLEYVSLVTKKYISSPPDRVAPMDLAKKILFLLTDITSKIAFNAKFNDLRDDNDNFGYIREVETTFPKLFCICTIPSVIEFLTNLGVLTFFAPKTSSKFGLGKLMAITKAQVAKRFDDGKPISTQPDMLGSFIRHGVTQEEAEREAVLQMVAGTDTTATGVRATFVCIITNPPVYAKLVEEIKLASERLQLGKDQVISDKQAREIPYLQACIKEGLRWLPPAVGMSSKKVPPNGETLCGHFVPGGVSIGYSAKAIHHSPALFGPDEDMFRPERWTLVEDGGHEQSAEKLKAMEKNNDLIFGSGRYQCLGKIVASIELNKIIFETLRRFEMTVCDPAHVYSRTCFGAHFLTDLGVMVKMRDDGAE